MLKRRAIIALCRCRCRVELDSHTERAPRSVDSPLYWTLGLPVVAALFVAIGLASEHSDWLWTFLIVPSQVTTLMVRAEKSEICGH
jgi:hypothetical protein